jgi:hypothetical protein
LNDIICGGRVSGEQYIVNSEAEMLALNAVVGDVAYRTDTKETFRLIALPPSVLANWAEVGGAVDSVFGRIGSVVALAGDYTTTLVTEGTNQYFTNARALTAVEKINNVTGFSVAGGTSTTKALTLLDNAQLNQDLLTSSVVQHSGLNLVASTPVLSLTDIADNDKSFKVQLNTSDNELILLAQDLGTGDYYDMKLNPGGEAVGVGYPAGTPIPEIFGGEKPCFAMYCEDGLYSLAETPDLNNGAVNATVLKTGIYNAIGGDRTNAVFQVGLLHDSGGVRENDRWLVNRAGIPSNDLCVFRSGNVGFNFAFDPGTTVGINGNMYVGSDARFDEIAAPAAPASGCRLFSNSADAGKPYVRLKNGTLVDLTSDNELTPAEVLTIVEKVNNASDWEMAGATGDKKTISVQSDCTIDQNLSTTSSVTHSEIRALKSSGEASFVAESTSPSSGVAFLAFRFKTSRYSTDGGTSSNTPFELGFAQDITANSDVDRMYMGRQGLSNTDLSYFNTGNFSFNSSIDVGDLVFFNGVVRHNSYSRFNEITTPGVISTGFGMFANSDAAGRPYAKLKTSDTAADVINGGNVIAVSSSQEIDLTTKMLLVDTTAGDVTLNWSQSLLTNHSVSVKKVAGTNNVILSPDSGTIEGVASLTISEVNATVNFNSDGTNSYIIDNEAHSNTSVLLPELTSAPQLPASGNVIFTLQPHNALHARGTYNSNGVPTDRSFTIDNSAGMVIIAEATMVGTLNVYLDRSAQFVTCATTNNPIVVLWNPAETQGKVFTIKHISGGNNVTLQPSSGLIDGAANFVFNSPLTAVQIESDGTNTYIINKYL